jgi:transcriptional regulator with XRE-family HTH domain
LTRKRREPSHVLGDQLRDLRKIAGGLTQDQLAERLRKLGSRLDATAIAKIETRTAKRRGVSLDEALEIAAALGISPAHLFMPRDKGAPVQIAPKLNLPGTVAREWLAGIAPLPGHDPHIFELARSEDEKAARPDSEVEQEELEAKDLAEAQALIKRLAKLARKGVGR